MKYFQFSKYLYDLPKDRSYYGRSKCINRVADVLTEENGFGHYARSDTYVIPEYLELELFRRQFESVTESKLSKEEMTNLRYLFDAYLMQFLSHGNERYRKYLVELETDEDFEKERQDLKETATQFLKGVFYCKDIWDWDTESITQTGGRYNCLAVPYLLCLLREDVPLSDPDVFLRFQRKKTSLDKIGQMSAAPKTRREMEELSLYGETQPLRYVCSGYLISRGFLEAYIEPLLKAASGKYRMTATIWDLQSCLREQKGSYNLQLKIRDLLFAPPEGLPDNQQTT